MAAITSPTVRVRDKAAMSLASTFKRLWTSLKISTRLMESIPSSVSNSMSSSIISVSYPVLDANTSMTTRVASAAPPLLEGADRCCGGGAVYCRCCGGGVLLETTTRDS